MVSLVGLMMLHYTFAALSSSLYPYDHACVPMVPSHGPAPPFVEGVIADSVCWDTLDLGQPAGGDIRCAKPGVE